MPVIVDASAMLEVLLRTPAGNGIATRLFRFGETRHAPHLLDIEVVHGIRRSAARGEIDAARGQGAIANLAAFPLRRHPHESLLPRIWALRHNFTAYDAAYVALSEALDAVLITRDRRLAAAGGHHARIEVI